MKPSISQKAVLCMRAYTLVEVMVSVGLLAVMLTACYPAFVLGFGSIKTTREDQRATQILTQKLEAVRLCTWGELSNYPSTFTEYYNPLGTNGSQGAAYSGTISTTAVATNLTTENYKGQVHLITMTVTWSNSLARFSVVHTRTMQTLSAYYGLQNYIW